jgi:hypothetical protein
MIEQFPAVPIGTNIYWEELKIVGSVVKREGYETTIQWENGQQSVVADDDDDPDQFTVIEAEVPQYVQ